MTDSSVKRQYVYLDQPDPPAWKKYIWNGFSLVLAGLPSVYVASRALTEAKQDRTERTQERASERAALAAERASERAALAAERATLAKEQADRRLIVQANQLIWQHNLHGKWFWQAPRPPVATATEARAIVKSVPDG